MHILRTTVEEELLEHIGDATTPEIWIHMQHSSSKKKLIPTSKN